MSNDPNLSLFKQYASLFRPDILSFPGRLEMLINLTRQEQVQIGQSEPNPKPGPIPTRQEQDRVGLGSVFWVLCRVGSGSSSKASLYWLK